MAKRDYTKFTVPISKKLDENARQAVATEIIDFIVDRTVRKKLDKNNNKFKKGYSESYASSLKGRIGGKRKGAIPNLKLTGEMMNSLTLLEDQPGKLTIGYRPTSDPKLLGRVEGNVRGSYGQKTGNRKNARNFMGIAKEDLKKIENKYKGKEATELAELIALAQEVSRAADSVTDAISLSTVGPNGEV